MVLCFSSPVTKKAETGSSRPPLSYDPLLFVTSNSRFVLTSFRDLSAKNEAPEEEAGKESNVFKKL